MMLKTNLVQIQDSWLTHSIYVDRTVATKGIAFSDIYLYLELISCLARLLNPFLESFHGSLRIASMNTTPPSKLYISPTEQPITLDLLAVNFAPSGPVFVPHISRHSRPTIPLGYHTDNAASMIEGGPVMLPPARRGHLTADLN